MLQSELGGSSWCDVAVRTASLVHIDKWTDNHTVNENSGPYNTKTSLLTELIRPVEFYLTVNEQSG